MKKTIITMVLLTLLLAACSGKGKADAAGSIPTLRLAHSWTGAGEANAAGFEGLLSRWIEQHKDIVTVQVEATAGMAHQEKIKIDLAAGDLPDLFAYWGGASNLAPMVDNNLLLDVDSYCAVSPTIRKDQWGEGAYANYTFNGKEYGFPMSGFTTFFIYNKALFDKFGLQFPGTYEELKAVSKVFIANGIVPMGGSSKGGDPGHIWYSMILYQLQGGLESRNLSTTGQFNTAATLEAARIVSEMKSLGMFPADTIANGSFDNCAILYSEGKCAMMVCAPWLVIRISEEVQAATGIGPFPKMTNAVVDPNGFVLGTNSQALVILRESFEDSTKQAALVQLADLLISDEMFIELAKARSIPPKKVELGEEMAQYLQPLLIKSTEYAATRATYVPNWFLMPSPSVAAAYLDGVDELFAGAVTPEGFVTKVQDAIDSE